MKKTIAVIVFSFLFLMLFIGCTSDATNRNAADTLVGANPQNIYFATGNDHYDLYVGHCYVPGPEITLLSRQEILKEDISVSLDIQAEYTVHITQQKREASLTRYEVTEVDGTQHLSVIDAGTYDFPLYLYQTYAGLDWAAVGKAWTQYQAVAEDGEQAKTALAEYSRLSASFISEYQSLQVSDLPVFYEYLIQITIDAAEVTETLTHVKIRIGEQNYDVQIGEITIRPNPGYGNGDPYFPMVASAPLWFTSYPYGKGLEQCQSAVFYAEQALTLNGIHFMENNCSSLEVMDMTVVIADSIEGVYEQQGIQILWDGEMEIFVPQGSYVGLYLTVHDSRLREIYYHGKLYPVLEFSCDNGNWEQPSEIPLYRHYTDSWLLYAIGLDGMNLESYFEDYYYVVVSPWRSQEDDG